MPPFDHKTQSRLIPAAESRLRGGEIVPARASLLASQIAGPGLNIISNRQFLVRLETAVNYSKQKVESDSNRHFWDPLPHNVCAKRTIYGVRHLISIFRQGTASAVPKDAAISGVLTPEVLWRAGPGILEIGSSATPAGRWYPPDRSLKWK